jgi:hypothetical protein
MRESFWAESEEEGFGEGIADTPEGRDISGPVIMKKL